jgi:hypothetical protein
VLILSLFDVLSLSLSPFLFHLSDCVIAVSYSVLQGSVGEYCLHNCKVPVIIVPGKGIMI